MSPEDQGQRIERIVVALDASPHSVSALEAAAQLAALLEAEVEALFIEDIDLLHVCGLPFDCQVDACTTTVRRVEAPEMERQLRVVAAGIQETVERVAGQASVRWSFTVRRGAVTEELLSAAHEAAAVSVGRTGRARRKGVGSTARVLMGRARGLVLLSGERGSLEGPLTVLYTGTPSARRALDLALRLARTQPASTRVVVWDGGEETVDVGELEQAVHDLVATADTGEGGPVTVIPIAEAAELADVLRRGAGGTLVLPREQSGLAAEDERPTLLVP